MVKHIVCFKLKDRKKSEEAKEILLSMRGKVPTAQEIEVGVDFLGSARSYDVFLSVTVSDGQALTEYQNDPYHVARGDGKLRCGGFLLLTFCGKGKISCENL